LDFGNSCFNDHHYHWGYYVVSGAMLVDLIPTMKDDAKFVDFINMFIRDIANPSKEDRYFPQFRSFDFFDMHSWSRGLKPDPSGKDQESTSEEVNFHYGLVMWGRMLGNVKMMKLGATVLTLASRSLQEYFLNKRDNANHPASFSKYHVTGIFFQNKVHLTSWFGQEVRFIHGIQMLPLTDGLLLSRKPDFCFEEWTDYLAALEVDYKDPWWSILFSGNLAMHSPDEAWSHLIQMDPSAMDDGLTKSWALYWTSVQKADGPRPTPAPTEAPAPSPPSPPGGEPSPGVFCDPMSDPAQVCPGGFECPQCGEAACECKLEPPAPPPAFCNPNTDPAQICPGQFPCPQCGNDACECIAPAPAEIIAPAVPVPAPTGKNSAFQKSIFMVILLSISHLLLA